MERNLKELVAQMTLEEKAGMCSGLDFWHLKGVERLGIPSVMVSDGPHGLRKPVSYTHLDVYKRQHNRPHKKKFRSACRGFRKYKFFRQIHAVLRPELSPKTVNTDSILNVCSSSFPPILSKKLPDLLPLL